MKTVTWGGLKARVVGGTDGHGGGDGIVVVLLHGYGAPGDDLVGLHPHVTAPAGTRFVFPHAPLSLMAGNDFGAFGMNDARAWWPIDVVGLERALATGQKRDFRSEHPAELPAAREHVLALLDEVKRELSPSKLVIGGFSQGAMLSLDVALHRGGFDGLLLFSGAYLSEDVWKPRFASLRDVPIAQSHGTHDPILPYGEAEVLARELAEAGARVTFTSFRGQHTIPMPALERAGALLTSLG